MEKETIYFIFTDTGTHLSKLINYFTRQSLNHVSIGFDKELTEVYSFGRKNPKNPFSGGFVRENIRGNFLKHADSAVFSLKVTAEEKEIIRSNIKRIEKNKKNYRYNFIGLIGVLLKIEIKRKYAFFCSEFVANVLKNTKTINLSKPTYFTTPSDIRNIMGMELIYFGKLGDYQYPKEPLKYENYETLFERKHSFLFNLKRKIKHIVYR